MERTVPLKEKFVVLALLETKRPLHAGPRGEALRQEAEQE